MKKHTATELKTILDSHLKWLMNEGGECANLTGANLHGANLSHAYLRDAHLSGADLTDANLLDADLHGADLHGVNLSSANLNYANLSGAYLTGANLSYANLSSATLSNADLRSADLSDANLKGADLSGANLSGANLRYAYLRSAYLKGANLRRANLKSANLDEIKSDFFKVLSKAKAEIAGLYQALLTGKIDGTVYEGDCACLVGTIANLKGVEYDNIKGLKPNSSRPSERWFLAISQGDTTKNNEVSAITKGWIEEFCKENDILLHNVL